MRIPYEKRVDRYDVEWRQVPADTEIGLSGFRYATITIHELWSIGHLIFPTDPLKIDVFFGDPKENTAMVSYDFGMDDKFSTDKNKNWMYNYGDSTAIGDDVLKTVFLTVKFDLMHTFFHYQGDPNYNHTHWALYGNLKHRVTADDSFIFDDLEEDEKVSRETKE
jgi:hypothetical protein